MRGGASTPTVGHGIARLCTRLQAWGLHAQRPPTTYARSASTRPARPSWCTAPMIHTQGLHELQLHELELFGVKNPEELGQLMARVKAARTWAELQPLLESVGGGAEGVGGCGTRPCSPLPSFACWSFRAPPTGTCTCRHLPPDLPALPAPFPCPADEAAAGGHGQRMPHGLHQRDAACGQGPARQALAHRARAAGHGHRVADPPNQAARRDNGLAGVCGVWEP